MSGRRSFVTVFTKFRAFVVIAAVVLIPFVAQQAVAAESCSQRQSKATGVTKEIYVSFQVAANGSFTTAICSGAMDIDGWIEEVVFIPGTTAYEATTDIQILDANGVDKLGGGGANLSATDADARRPLDSNGLTVLSPIFGPFQLAISGNTTGDATGVIKMSVISFKGNR